MVFQVTGLVRFNLPLHMKEDSQVLSHTLLCRARSPEVHSRGCELHVIY